MVSVLRGGRLPSLAVSGVESALTCSPRRLQGMCRIWTLEQFVSSRGPVFASSSTLRRNFATLPVAKHVVDPSSSTSSGITSVGASSYQLVEEDLATIYREIKSELNCDLPELVELAQYYFSAHGKAFRPMVVLLMAAVCAKHCGGLAESIVKKQRRVAVIAEMIHTASLIHDDVIDEAETRRNQPSLHKVWGEKKAILTGDYILSVASRELARLRNPDVIICLAQVIEDLVKGELMQIGSRDAKSRDTKSRDTKSRDTKSRDTKSHDIKSRDAAVSERFEAYLSKTYHKTASLMANSCKAVAMLSGCTPDFVEKSFLFGKNLGMAFQLVDDNLDFISTEEKMGKPTSVDMKLGLATAPVLLAAEKVPELNALIARRFQQAGDVQTAQKMVFENGGVEETRRLAARYSQEAVSQLSAFSKSEQKDALIETAEIVLRRTK